MFKYLSPFFVLLSSGMHLFCCGIPLLLSISSLGVIFGISGTAFEIEWFEAIEDKVMVVSGFVLFLSFFVDQFNKQRVCNEHAENCPDISNKKSSNKLTQAALVLYAVNLLVIFFS